MLNSVQLSVVWVHILLGITYFWGVIHNPAFVITGSWEVFGTFTTPILIITLSLLGKLSTGWVSELILLAIEVVEESSPLKGYWATVVTL